MVQLGKSTIKLRPVGHSNARGHVACEILVGVVAKYALQIALTISSNDSCLLSP